MNYDVLNRLKERNLPNGMKSTWEYDDLDRIQSVTHKAANGTVVSSIAYDRNASGEPNKITREDGTYRTLQYDSALRVTKESFYNAQNTLVDETSYVYDAAGKRIATVKNLDTQTYKYDKGYQLDSITGTNPEDYAYDTNGRMDLIQRDGKTLDLDHDVYDRLTAVKNLTSATTTNYVYDGQGRRITATTENETRQFLIAPVMGGGLDSTDMMTDGAGNLTANYVYAGGYSPFMKLDGQGNPIYYLSDDMGSVIGMADQSGQNVSKFSYDSFGNIRNQSGNLADRTGGDFRFQGQWLESAMGIYNFRARDYDSRTGTFLSRDPVDPTAQEVEAMNPYQAMYNNAYVYSDPTGMWTMGEISVSNAIMKALNGVKSYSVNQTKEYIKDQVTDYVGGAVFRAITDLIPANIAEQKLQPYNKGAAPWEAFEDMVMNAFCNFFKDLDFADNIYFQVALDKRGKALSDGYSCSDFEDTQQNNKRLPSATKGVSKPSTSTGKREGVNSADYLFKPSSPQSGKRDGWIIGDFKLGVDDMYKKYITNNDSEGQLTAINQYVKKSQLVPVTAFVTYEGGSVNAIRTLKKASLKQGVAMFIKSLEWSGRNRGKF